jgi:hypothetical protein
MNRLKRAIRNWLGINVDSSYPHRFVALTYWRDSLIGVDGNGDMYELRQDHLGQPTVELMMRNPLER